MPLLSTHPLTPRGVEYTPPRPGFARAVPQGTARPDPAPPAPEPAERDWFADFLDHMGCNGCPLVDRDVALDALLRLYPAEWGHLAPLKRLRGIYRELRLPRNRLRQPGGERRKDGKLSPNQHRMGPLTMEARRWARDQVLQVQAEINADAARLGLPGVDILDAKETARIEALWAANTWPERWTGDEPRADLFFTEAGELFHGLGPDPDAYEAPIPETGALSRATRVRRLLRGSAR